MFEYVKRNTPSFEVFVRICWIKLLLNEYLKPKTKDDFLTAGIGYVAKNIDEKSDLNFNFFYTQSTNNSLNSSLFSISYNKTF